MASSLHAQNRSAAPAADSAVFKVNARLVVLDVVVTDQSGKPVEGLGAKDFQVFEDGKLQTIRSVESPVAHVLPGVTQANISEVFDPAKPANFGSSPVSILVLDQLNTHFADSSFARRCLHDYLASQPELLPQPTVLLGVSDSHFKQLLPFTRDRNALLAALAGTHTEYAWKLEINGKTDYGPVERLDQSLRAIEEIAQSYAAIPGRKNLIWVGGGFPTIDPTVIDGDDAQEVKDALRRITDVMLDTRMALYAVDPSSSAAGMTEITDASQMDFVQAAGDGLTGGADPFGANDDFNRLGPVTGGRVVRGRNDVSQQIAASVELGARFYTIAYSPTSSDDTSAPYRKIRVVCLQHGLTATTRSGYYPGELARASSSASAVYDLTTAAESALPLNGVRVRVEPDSAPDAFVVHAGASSLSWKTKQDGSATASVYIMAVALDAKNNMLRYTLHGMTANAKPGADLNSSTKTADFAFKAPALDKAVTLRIVVRDNATGRTGSFDLAVKKR